MLLTTDLWEIWESQVREVLSCLGQQFFYKGLLLLLGPTHVVGGCPSLIQHGPIVLKVQGVDPIDRFLGPGLVLDPIPLAFPLEDFVPYAGGTPGSCSAPGLFRQPPLPIRMEVVVLVLLLLVLFCPCLALILQDPLNRRSACLEGVFGPC